MYKILIVEDNLDVNRMLSEALKTNGYDVQSAYNGIDGMKAFDKDKFDLILLDIMLPYKSGDEVLKELRSKSDIPVIIISAKDLTSTKIDLLKLGADDYITKPFDLDEVAARIETNLRRWRMLPEQDMIYCYKSLTMNKTAKSVLLNDTVLELTVKEYGILELLIEHQGKVFTKANLYESIWNEEYIGDDNVLKTHMSNLRAKLKKADPEAEYIETVWGLGYRIPID